jgi:hypothetical protein
MRKIGDEAGNQPYEQQQSIIVTGDRYELEQPLDITAGFGLNLGCLVIMPDEQDGRSIQQSPALAIDLNGPPLGVG